ncbi:hypothetical protein TGME49_253160 [Toxoplasma gondii ME49]|uniref:Uncharacterized protein n=2 Tax=Toxoplasma gondii TaxID=5811 RepID=S8GTE8_TOXGM|nr:hypothetical protein TGME49_253160 [Toxoplasma gondii ME49]EPT31829.1 hypothetical protein TGME49_253160 [Toxoplasma gondii ME49]KYF41846.1 hypothetical protein TGARI_253160 [Toxoplasma gondii ARI]|eukprot:XP_002369383.1 hypothetical protein TGME49_253160 [Toxoplasma gondii ME49]
METLSSAAGVRTQAAGGQMETDKGGPEMDTGSDPEAHAEDSEMAREEESRGRPGGDEGDPSHSLEHAMEEPEHVHAETEGEDGQSSREQTETTDEVPGSSGSVDDSVGEERSNMVEADMSSSSGSSASPSSDSSSVPCRISYAVSSSINSSVPGFADSWFPEMPQETSATPFSSPPLKRQAGAESSGVQTPQRSAECPAGSDARREEANEEEGELTSQSRAKEETREAASEEQPEGSQEEGQKVNKGEKKTELFLGMWPEHSGAGGLELPSLLHLAAACKQFSQPKQARDFLETLSAEEKTQLQRRYHRVARQLARVSPVRPMPQEKFRLLAPTSKAKEDVWEIMREQEKQLRCLQPHDIVFANLQGQLKELFPERSEAALYDLCRRVCALAKQSSRKDVLGPLKRALSHARFALAREHRKLRSQETAESEDS